MTLPPEPTSTRTVGRVTIVALITAQFFVTLDGSAVTVALPTIRDTLDANAMGLQWATLGNPIRHFLVILRGVYLKGTGLRELWPQFLAMALIAGAALTFATNRFRRSIA